MSRLFYNYTIWECQKSRLYLGIDGGVEKHSLLVMKNYKLWGDSMVRMVDKWPVSCNQFLSDPTTNKRAWIGQASMACFHNTSGSTTKKLWFMLNKNEQTMANAQADKAIKKWREQCLNSVQISMF
jgi:hypothetical protein